MVCKVHFLAQYSPTTMSLYYWKKILQKRVCMSTFIWSCVFKAGKESTIKLKWDRHCKWKLLPLQLRIYDLYVTPQKIFIFLTFSIFFFYFNSRIYCAESNEKVEDAWLLGVGLGWSWAPKGSTTDFLSGYSYQISWETAEIIA